jgi:hypothetical protein
MNVHRYGHLMGVMDGKLVVAQGYQYGTKQLDTIEIMNDDGTWKLLPQKVSWKSSMNAMATVPPKDFPCKKKTVDANGSDNGGGNK